MELWLLVEGVEMLLVGEEEGEMCWWVQVEVFVLLGLLKALLVLAG